MVPADKKWVARLVVTTVVFETLFSLDLKYPTVDKARLK